MAKNFPASDEFIAWAQSLSGMLTNIRTEYGGIAEMVEHPAWDEAKTQFAVALIKSLHSHLAQIDAELTNHVQEKFGKGPR
jgi:hypothetical protein